MASLAAAVVLTLGLDDAALTPLLLMLTPDSIPGVKWLVFGAQVGAAVVFIIAPRGFALGLVMLLALANVLALPLNALSAVLFSRWSGNATNWVGVLLFLYYVDQVVTLVCAWIASRSLPQGERRYGLAFAIVAMWALALFSLAEIARPPALSP